MVKIRINDATTKRSKDDNGFLIIKDNPIAKAGVFEYLLSEVVSLENKDDDKVIKVCRTFDNLKENKDKFANMPIKEGHIWVGTDGDTNFADGAIGSEVRAEEPYLVADLIIYNPTLIDKIENGEVVELSPAYEALFQEEQGTYNGESYEYLQLLSSVNHLAVVDEGRSGHDLKILDKKNKGVSLMKLKNNILNSIKKILDEGITNDDTQVNDGLDEVATKILEIANGEGEDKVSQIVEILAGLKDVGDEGDDDEPKVNDDEPKSDDDDEPKVNDDEVDVDGDKIELSKEELVEIISEVTDAKIAKFKKSLVADNNKKIKAYKEVRDVVGCDFDFNDKSIDDIYTFGYEVLAKTKLEDGMDALTAFKAMKNQKMPTTKTQDMNTGTSTKSEILELLATHK